MTPAARAQAAIELLDAILNAARDGGAAADTIITRYFRDRRYAGSKDRRAIREHVYAAIRRFGEPPVSGRAAMVALAQEDADLAALFSGEGHGPAPIQHEEPVAGGGALPAWLEPLFAAPVERDGLLDRAALHVRVNRLKADRAQLLPLLPEGSASPLAPDAIHLPEGFAVEGNDAWAQGLIEIQDEGSQYIAAACQVKPGQTVIDLCAGAGGKTLALAADMENAGRLIATDTVRDRLARLAPRAERAGATVETRLLNPNREAEVLADLAGQADVVLVDAPCSGTGTWRRNPEARWRLTPARLDRLESEQARIADIAATLAKPGGTMVYAVCSLLDREGRGQVDAFLRRHPDWIVDPIDGVAGRPWGPGLLLTPAHDRTDGFYFARLRKS